MPESSYYQRLGGDGGPTGWFNTWRYHLSALEKWFSIVIVVCIIIIFGLSIALGKANAKINQYKSTTTAPSTTLQGPTGRTSISISLSTASTVSTSTTEGPPRTTSEPTEPTSSSPTSSEASTIISTTPSTTTTQNATSYSTSAASSSTTTPNITIASSTSSNTPTNSTASSTSSSVLSSTLPSSTTSVSPSPTTDSHINSSSLSTGTDSAQNVTSIGHNSATIFSNGSQSTPQVYQPEEVDNTTEANNNKVNRTSTVSGKKSLDEPSEKSKSLETDVKVNDNLTSTVSDVEILTVSPIEEESRKEEMTERRNILTTLIENGRKMKNEKNNVIKR